jgi:uncharacterized secreted protein with C-terminal beta-propeller domain
MSTEADIMATNGEGHEDTRSLRSINGSLYLGDDDRRYLELLKDKDYVVTKKTSHPLGLFSVVAFILQQVIGKFQIPGSSKVSIDLTRA